MSAARETSHHHHHRHDHHHRHHRRRSFRSWLKRHRWVAPGIIAVLLGVLATLLWLNGVVHRQRALDVENYSSGEVDLGYYHLTWQGKNYRYNNRVRTILYAGVDSDGPMKRVKYTMAPRADSINLLVMDEKHNRISVIAISRDTMTAIHRYTMDGRDRGEFQDHLGYAFSYGDGARDSGRNLTWAVSNLLGGIPIGEYVVTNRSSLKGIMDILGPVKVTVPNNDLAGEYPEMTAGAVVEINGENIERYLRQRDTQEDLSNIGRMARQQSLVSSIMGEMQTILQGGTDTLWKKIQSMEDYLVTSVTRNKYLDITRLLRTLSFEEGSYYQLPGENVVGSDHDEFYPDEEGVMELVVSLFYDEV